MPAPDALAARLRRVLAGEQAARRLPSIAGAVVRSGEVVWTDAVGVADAARAENATADHQYRIGSITKTFTAVAVMQLRARGALELSDHLDDHLDGVPHRLTLRGLLSHASGLQREIPGDVWDTMSFPSSTEELLARLAEAEQVLQPGERWHYSNLAYVLLGEVVARVSGMPYEDYVERRVLDPLGLSRTGFAPSGPTATAYTVAPYSDVVHEEPMLVERTGGIAAAGQLWSTVGDLARWAGFLADPEPDVLGDDALDLMCAVQTMADPYRWERAWGVGLMLVRRGDRIYAGHDGGMPGYLASVLVSREEKLGAAVLTNAGSNVDPQDVAVKLIEETRDLFPPEPEPWTPGEAPPDDVAGVLGRWWSEGTEFVFRWREGTLEARAADAAEHLPWARFRRLGDDRYRTVFGRERGELLRVVRAEDGTATRLYWATYPFTRAPQVFGADADG